MALKLLACNILVALLSVAFFYFMAPTAIEIEIFYIEPVVILLGISFVFSIVSLFKVLNRDVKFLSNFLLGVLAVFLMSFLFYPASTRYVYANKTITKKIQSHIHKNFSGEEIESINILKRRKKFFDLLRYKDWTVKVFFKNRKTFQTVYLIEPLSRSEKIYNSEVSGL